MGTVPQRGFEGCLYVNTGTYAAPTWVEIDMARDLTDIRDHEEIDVTTRGTARRGYKAGLAGTTPLGYEFEVLVPAAGESNSAYTKIRAALKARTNVDILHVEGGDIDTDDLAATRIICQLTGGGAGEPLSGAKTESYKAQFTPNGDQEAPEEGTVSSGAFVPAGS